MNEQMAFDGMEPGKIKKGSGRINPPHLPTQKDAEELRRWLRQETCLPGVTEGMIAHMSVGGKLKALSEIPRRYTITTRERSRLLALADKWEKDAKRREGR